MPHIQASKGKGKAIDGTGTDSHEKRVEFHIRKRDAGNREEDMSKIIELGFLIEVDNPEWQVELAKCKTDKSGKKNTM